MHSFRHDKINQLSEFCRNNKVGMSSFNLDELEHIHHNFPGHVNHHIRAFLKDKMICKAQLNVTPGDRESEAGYVNGFDDNILKIIPDASDAVLFVQAIRMQADILTKDRHHIFTAAAENYSHLYNINVLNEFP